MATGNYLAWIAPTPVIPADGKVPDTLTAEVTGRGWVFPPGVKTTHRVIAAINQSLGAAAALDLKILASSDPLGRFGGSGNAYIGVLGKVLANGQTLSTGTGAGTAVYEPVAMNATPGAVTVHVLDVTNAEADSPAAGDFLLLEITRDGTVAASDTSLDQIIIHSMVLIES